MPAPTSYTKTLTRGQAEKLRALLEEKSFVFEEKPYCLLAAANAAGPPCDVEQLLAASANVKSPMKVTVQRANAVNLKFGSAIKRLT